MSRRLVGLNPEEVDIVVDAEGHVVGRLASVVARWLMEGRRVTIFNAEKAVLTGSRRMLIEWYKRKISEWRTHYNPEKVGPKIPRRPDRILRRIIRGMLPHKRERGRKALKRLRVFLGTPPGVDLSKAVAVEPALFKPKPGSKYITLEELWREVDFEGWSRWRQGCEVLMKLMGRGQS